MCKYCEKNSSLYRITHQKDYTLSCDVSISRGRLVVENHTRRFTERDRYYDSWGIDQVGERANQTIGIPIHFCPFCGRKLEGAREPIIWVLEYDRNAYDKFIASKPKLKKYLEKINELRHDTSPLHYRLSSLLEDTLVEYLDEAYSTHCEFIHWFCDYGCEQLDYIWKDASKFLSEYTDVMFKIDSDYSNKDKVLKKLESFGKEIRIIKPSSIKYSVKERLFATFKKL